MSQITCCHLFFSVLRHIPEVPGSHMSRKPGVWSKRSVVLLIVSKKVQMQRQNLALYSQSLCFQSGPSDQLSW
jgi:hypothetical protein